MKENSVDLINKIQTILQEEAKDAEQVVEILGHTMVNFGCALNNMDKDIEGPVNITQEIIHNIQLRYYKEPNIADAMILQGISMLKTWDLTKEEGKEAAERMRKDN